MLVSVVVSVESLIQARRGGKAQTACSLARDARTGQRWYGLNAARIVEQITNPIKLTMSSNTNPPAWSIHARGLAIRSLSGYSSALRAL
jgi:hypothetical protein